MGEELEKKDGDLALIKNDANEKTDKINSLKNELEKKYEIGYNWIREKTNEDAFIITSAFCQVSLFTERQSGFVSLDDVKNEYDSIYFYNIENDVYARLNNTYQNYPLAYHDDAVSVYKLK